MIVWLWNIIVFISNGMTCYFEIFSPEIWNDLIQFYSDWSLYLIWFQSNELIIYLKNNSMDFFFRWSINNDSCLTSVIVRFDLFRSKILNIETSNLNLIALLYVLYKFHLNRINVYEWKKPIIFQRTSSSRTSGNRMGTLHEHRLESVPQSHEWKAGNIAGWFLKECLVVAPTSLRECALVARVKGEWEYCTTIPCRVHSSRTSASRMGIRSHDSSGIA